MKKAEEEVPFIAFVCEDGDVALDCLPPALAGKVLQTGNTMADFDPKRIRAILYKPPGSEDVVRELFQRVLKETGRPVRWVHSFYAGVEALKRALGDLVMEQHDTVITNGRGAFSSSLAEFCLAAMLHFNKHVPKLQDNFKARVWEKFEMDTLRGKTVGFMGWGSIAKATAQLLCPAFGVNVLTFHRKNTALSKLELAQQSDFIINTLPSTEETRNCADAEFFAAMRPNAVFINVGRGDTVDEDALARALCEGRIRGACLDVFKVEPLPPGSVLYTCPNLLLSNHNADHTKDWVQLGWRVFEENYNFFLRDFEESGDAKPTLVDLKLGY